MEIPAWMWILHVCTELQWDPTHVEVAGNKLRCLKWWSSDPQNLIGSPDIPHLIVLQQLDLDHFLYDEDGRNRIPHYISFSGGQCKLELWTPPPLWNSPPSKSGRHGYYNCYLKKRNAKSFLNMLWVHLDHHVLQKAISIRACLECSSEWIMM
jgi:hypothetical protein